ncbi:hypothetical protein PHISCL_08790 [Aspergillus sclerotialis]|uniref:magnesium chelatase n=1 Tax=Aspergillus sclerotialis TaxID=2070753 RepID=A0A3A2ZHS3_9EURO|nr:hypothetical protein PHISCL_08790 [Aspergillus sclerotialis]
MEPLSIADLAPELSSLEVALLLSLGAHEHCLIETTEDAINDVAKELALISSNTFDLSYTILNCSPATSLDSFYKEILDTRSHPPLTPPPTDSLIDLSRFQTAQESINRNGSSDQTTLNVVIAKNFNHVNDYIQLQTLELIRSRKLTTQSISLTTPEQFLFISVVARNSDQLHPRLNPHLNDHLFISHFHDPNDGFAYLEEGNDWLSDGQSGSSIVHKKKYPKVNAEALASFSNETKSININAEVSRYIQDIVMFLRLNRAVAGGITSKANGHFQKFSRLLAPLHGLDFLTPSLVKLAARKVFRHRIILAKPEDDRSLQYGSDIKAVARVLKHVTPDSILDEVLELEVPL